METPQLIVLNLILLILVFVVNVRVQARAIALKTAGHFTKDVIMKAG